MTRRLEDHDIPVAAAATLISHRLAGDPDNEQAVVEAIDQHQLIDGLIVVAASAVVSASGGRPHNYLTGLIRYSQPMRTERS